MFDTYKVGNPGPSHVTSTITHHHAPTTEQARYLDELREQARQDVMSGVLRETPFGRIHVRLFRMDASCAEEYEISFLLGGKLQSFKVEVDDVRRANSSPGELDDYVFKRLVDQFLSHHGGRVVPHLPRSDGPAL